MEGSETTVVYTEVEIQYYTQIRNKVLLKSKQGKSENRHRQEKPTET